MNLVLIAALAAVCGAAKLDRTYLPPPSAKTAGGTAGSLQTPFAGNSFNQGLGGLPKGGFTNEFQGVVVDAAAAGIRASEGETGLGAPRPTYGSTNSKVGDAAFRGNAGFRLPTTYAIDAEEHLDSDVQAANAQLSGLSQGFGANTNFEAKPERAQAAYDRAANVIQLENEVGSDAYRYSFETDNGISASENGVATNGVQAQGGYSYTGDDGQVYSVTYTADEGGYQPKGDHLPTPPPIPDEILKSLEQNARDEAAGLNDDGTYDAQKYNAGADYSESDNTNVDQNDKSAPSFGRRPESDATASGSFISQNNQAFVRPSSSDTIGRNDGKLNVQSSSKAIRPSNAGNTLDHNSQSNQLQSNGFGSRNEYIASTSTLKQNGRPQRPVNSPINNNQQLSEGMHSNFQFSPHKENEKNIIKPFEGLNRNTFMVQGSAYEEKPLRNNGFKQTSNPISSLAAGNFGLNSGNQFPSRNEYLPPVSGSLRPQTPLSTIDSRPESSFSEILGAGNIKATGQASLASNADAKEPQPFNNFSQNQQSLNNGFSQNSNRYPVKKQKETDDEQNVLSLESQRPTSIPSIELTTPLESSETQNNFNKPSNHAAPSINAQNFNAQPSSQLGSLSTDRQSVHSLPNAQTLTSNTHLANSDQNQYFSSTSNQQSFNNEPIHEKMPLEHASKVRPSTQLGSQSSNRQPTRPLSNSHSQVSNTDLPARDQSQYSSSTSNQQYSKNEPIREIMPSGQTSNISPSSQFGSQSNNKQQTRPLSNTQSQVLNTDLPARDQSQYSSSTGNEQLSQYGANLGTSPENIPNGQNFNARPTSQFGNKFSNKEPAHTLSNTQNQVSNIGFPTTNQNQYSSVTGNQQPSQNGFAHDQFTDAQYSPSTVRPVFNQQSQGADDSYYYRQPAKPFNTPTTSSSRFPSLPTGQFNRITQQSQPQFLENTQATVPVDTFQSQREQPNRGSTRYPEPPTLASATPTASINGLFQGSTTSSQYNGITQAAVSSFQSQNGQASSKYPRPPTLAPTAPTTSLGGFSTQQKGVTQTAASGAPTAPTFGARPTFQSQYSQQFQSSPEPSFGQRNSQTPSKKDQEDNSQVIPTQQYSGEIYQYTKPSERLPAPSKPASTSSPQRGQPQPQFGQVQGNSQRPNTQQPTGPSFGMRQQFGSQLSQRPQFSQGTTQNTNDQPTADTMPQFIVQSRPYGPDQQQVPQDSARPQFGQNNGRPSNCCQSLDAQITKLESQQPQTNNQGFTRPQFAQAESQFSGPVAQSSSQAFAGRGEVFGGPRKPPSFDQETGYHY